MPGAAVAHLAGQGVQVMVEYGMPLCCLLVQLGQLSRVGQLRVVIHGQAAAQFAEVLPDALAGQRQPWNDPGSRLRSATTMCISGSGDFAGVTRRSAGYAPGSLAHDAARCR